MIWTHLGKLTMLFGLAGLCASRLGLLVHEFLGHGGMATVLGGKVTGWRLFLFGGGWIQYDLSAATPSELLWISLGGVLLEMATAACLILASKRLPPIVAVVAQLMAMLLLAHTCYYIATGIHYGFGDGRVVANALSGWPVWGTRLILVVLSGLFGFSVYLICRTAWNIALGLSVPAGRTRLASVLVAILFAGGIHGGLYAVEVSLIDKDQTYSAIMERENTRRLAKYLAEMEKMTPLQTPDEIQVAKQTFVAANRHWPLQEALWCGGLLALCFAAYRGNGRNSTTEDCLSWSWKQVAVSILLLMLLLIAIATIDAMSP